MPVLDAEGASSLLIITPSSTPLVRTIRSDGFAKQCSRMQIPLSDQVMKVVRGATESLFDLTGTQNIEPSKLIELAISASLIVSCV